MLKIYRYVRRTLFKLLRAFVFSFWRLWVRKAVGLELVPVNQGCIVVSNHTSYFDFFVLASVLRKQAVFVAVKGLNQRNFVGWFMKLDTIVYVDRDKPGLRFFKEIIRHLNNNKTVVLYPEGTRSRSGNMLSPKIGFIKLAMKTNVPIVPIAMVGAYDILPPHKKLPAFKRCEVYADRKIYISPATDFLKDIFFQRQNKDRYEDLTDEEMENIAFRIMNKIRIVSGQKWDESSLSLALKYKMG